MALLVLHLSFDEFLPDVQRSIPAKQSQIALLKLFENLSTLCIKHLTLEPFNERILLHLRLSLHTLPSEHFPRGSLLPKHKHMSCVPFPLQVFSLKLTGQCWVCCPSCYKLRLCERFCCCPIVFSLLLKFELVQSRSLLLNLPVIFSSLFQLLIEFLIEFAR